MRAAVVQNVDFAVLMARHQHFMLGQAGADEVARIAQLAFVSDVKPQPAENSLLLKREHLRVGIGAAMDMIRSHQRANIVAAQRLIGCGGHLNSPSCYRADVPDLLNSEALRKSRNKPATLRIRAPELRAASPFPHTASRREVSLPNSVLVSIASSASPKPNPATAWSARRCPACGAQRLLLHPRSASSSRMRRYSTIP